LVDGTLNKQTKEEIQAAVRRAQEAFEIATQSLFKDASSYSFDSYQEALASPVNLKDLEDFTLKFLARERRQVQRKDGLYEFLTPEAMKENGLDERYRRATFDRATAIRNSQADFLALGHPFIDAMLRRVGDYSFGGHNAVRVIRANGIDSVAPQAGYQFNFTVRSRVQREDGDEYLFDLHTVVVLPDGSIDAELSSLAASSYSENESLSPQAERALDSLDKMDAEEAYQHAKNHVERNAQLWDWEEDVELIGVARVVALPVN